MVRDSRLGPLPPVQDKEVVPGDGACLYFSRQSCFFFHCLSFFVSCEHYRPLLRVLTMGKISRSSQAGSSLSLGNSALSYFGGDVAAISISVLAWVWLLERKEEGGNGLGSWAHSLQLIMATDSGFFWIPTVEPEPVCVLGLGHSVLVYISMIPSSPFSRNLTESQVFFHSQCCYGLTLLCSALLFFLWALGWEGERKGLYIHVLSSSLNVKTFSLS